MKRAPKACSAERVPASARAKICVVGKSNFSERLQAPSFMNTPKPIFLFTKKKTLRARALNESDLFFILFIHFL